MRSWLLIIGLAVACGSPPSSLKARSDGGSSPDARRPSVPPNRPPAGDPLSSAPTSLSCTASAAANPRISIKNVVLILGDGMGVHQLLAARALQGGSLRLESLRGPVFVNTDSLTTLSSGSPTDSAASATAMATGELVANGAIGVKDDADLDNLTELMRADGAVIGLVTTANLYDASPMAFVAHAANRGNTEEILDEVFTDALPEVLMG
ncbi:MAG: alkaline phosphatase, partial [Deltaproteobacteria bacterium]|nr:alkaline phosphatase [Deltaproteobacteria bacterium]